MIPVIPMIKEYHLYYTKNMPNCKRNPLFLRIFGLIFFLSRNIIYKILQARAILGRERHGTRKHRL